MTVDKLLDTQYEDEVITAVDGSGDYYDIRMGSSGFGLSKEHGVEPKVGQRVRLYGGFGHTIRGVDLDGEEVFYRTEAEQREINLKEVEKMKQERREKFEKDKAQLDADYDSLPPIFQRRLDKFRRNNPDFRWEYEAYEMFCCKEAVKFAEALKTPEGVRDFYDKPWDEQRALVDIGEGHSGNTFGAACQLAVLYLDQPESVEKMHGALAPLVGSEEYGCIPKESE